jgi:hypothetical protein
MPAQLFETALSSIFVRCDQALRAALDKVKTRAETLQAEDTSRLAFTLTEAIEHTVDPAIDEAVASYDEALGHPVASNPQWEEAIRARISVSVEAGVAGALAFDQLSHPWKPLLKEEAPKLSERLVRKADQRLAEVHKRHGPQRRRKQVRREWTLRVSLLILGLVLGFLLHRLISPS